jgi:hypothetical protein
MTRSPSQIGGLRSVLSRHTPEYRSPKEPQVRVDNRRPRQPVTWIPQVLELFKQKGVLTSNELAHILGKTLGGDAVTRCRQRGLPIEAVGRVPGNRLLQKLYALDIPIVWLALEEAVKQIGRYARLLSLQDGETRPSFAGAAAWIRHCRTLENQTSTPSSENGHLHQTRQEDHQ